MTKFIDKYELKELKAYSKPPQPLKELMNAVFILFFDKYSTWKDALVLLNNDTKFIEMINEFDASKITSSKKEKLKVIVENPDFTIEKIKNVSLAGVGLYTWIKEVYSKC